MVNANHLHPLRAWRHENHMTAADLGRVLDVGKVAVFRYESGDRFPRADVLERISRVTGGAVTAQAMLDAYRGGGNG